jgi:hypothetical protein
VSNYRTIWKATLNYGHNIVKIPRGSAEIHVAAQGRDPVIWFIFDEDRKRDLVKRSYNVVYTGETILRTGMRYLGTSHGADGLVLHVFAEDDFGEEEV